MFVVKFHYYLPEALPVYHLCEDAYLLQFETNIVGSPIETYFSVSLIKHDKYPAFAKEKKATITLPHQEK